MSTDAQTRRAGSVPGPAGGPAQGADPAGQLLRRLTVLPAMLVLAWLLVSLPLLLLGVFRPLPMLVLSVPLAAGLVLAVLRWVPQASPPDPASLPDPAGWAERARTPWWVLIALVVIAAGFGADQFIYHAQQIIIMRDPASYIQFGNWLAGHGSLPIPADRAAFGPAHQVLHFKSFAFYQVGGTVVPQFMAGLPMLLAGGFWAGGVSTAVAMGALFGALGVLAFGGLVARLAGPRWAPLAALVLALSLPEQLTSRSTYSEPVVQILFLGGLCLIIDSLLARGRGAQVAAALGGLAVGMTLLVRIDGASDVLPLIPYIGLLLIGRRPQAVPMLGGLVAGGLYGVVDGLLLSRPYLHTIKSSLVPLALVGIVVVLATVAAVVVLRERGLPEITGSWLPNAAAALAFVVTLGFIVRPYVQTTHTAVTGATRQVIASFQRDNHLLVDPTRTYYEISLHGVFWYIGVPAVLLGTLGAAVLARRCVRGRAPAWTLPLMIFAWTIVTTLYRPSITPDQPWASRRLVPAVLPGFILLAVWALPWLTGWLRRHDYDRVFRAGVGTVGVAALIIPAVMTTYGLGIKPGGPLGVRPTSTTVAFTRTYRGEAAAIARLCTAIPGNASVLIVDGSVADHLSEVVRGMCDVPVARLPRWTPTPAQVRDVVSSIRQAGRQPVLLAAKKSELTRYGGSVREVMALRIVQDGHTLTTPPKTTWTVPFNVWMTEPPR